MSVRMGHRVAREEKPRGSAAEEVIAAIVPAGRSDTGVGVRPLPLTELASLPGDGSLRYSVVTVDSRGRLADRAAVEQLGWRPGRRLRIEVARGVVIVSTDECGLGSVSRQGYVRIPAVVRRWVEVRAGQRVLVATARGHDVLLVHPPSVLDAMMRSYYQAGSSR